MKASAEAETMVGSLEFTLPRRTNSVYQKQGILDCGFFVLGWMEEELRASRGEWLRAWIEHSLVEREAAEALPTLSQGEGCH